MRRKREEFYLLFIAQKIGTLSEREGVISIRSLHLLERERYERKERKKREVFSCFCVRVCVFVVLPPTFERDERRSVRDYHILVRLLSGELEESLFSLCDDFFNERERDASANDFANECENQQKYAYLFCRHHEKRKDEDERIVFVFVTFTTLFAGVFFSHEEGV